MEILDYIKKNYNNNLEYKTLINYDTKKINLNIFKTLSDKEIQIKYLYIVSKDKFLEILKKYSTEEEKKYLINIEDTNYNLDIGINFTKKLSEEEFQKLFGTYLYSISYEKMILNKCKSGEDDGEDNEEKDKEKDVSETEVKERYELSFEEAFYYDLFNRISFITDKKDNHLGYGLFDKNYKNHYTILLNDFNSKNIFNYGIYKNGKFCLNDDIKELDNIIEEIFKNYLITVPSYKLTGNIFYTNLKIICLDSLKKLNIDIRIINNIQEIINKSSDSKDIIYVIREKAHISVLLKINSKFISLDSSYIHKNILKNYISDLKYFPRRLQTTGVCSYYTIKILEIILEMENTKTIINDFNDGILLINIILKLSDFFITLNKKKYFSKAIDELNMANKNFNIVLKNDLTLSIDDLYFLNKFVRVKSLFFNLKLGYQLDKELQETENKIILITQYIKTKKELDKNLNSFQKLYKNIQNDSELNELKEGIKNHLEETLQEYTEEKENIEKMHKFGISVLNNEANLVIENDKNLIFNMFNLNIYNKLSKLDEISKFYDKNHESIMFLRFAGGYFNQYCSNKNINIHFEEGNEI